MCISSQSSHEEDNQIIMNVLKVQQYLLNTTYADTNARPIKMFIQLHHGESQRHLQVNMGVDSAHSRELAHRAPVVAAAWLRVDTLGAYGVSGVGIGTGPVDYEHGQKASGQYAHAVHT